MTARKHGHSRLAVYKANFLLFNNHFQLPSMALARCSRWTTPWTPVMVSCGSEEKKSVFLFLGLRTASHFVEPFFKRFFQSPPLCTVAAALSIFILYSFLLLRSCCVSYFFSLLLLILYTNHRSSRCNLPFHQLSSVPFNLFFFFFSPLPIFLVSLSTGQA